MWRWWTRVEVDGISMAPTLYPGERLLVRRTKRVRRGDLVVVCDPVRSSRHLIKRVAAVSLHGVEVVGDHAEHSSDSRRFGVVPWSSVVGRPVYRYAPPGRAGRLR